MDKGFKTESDYQKYIKNSKHPLIINPEKKSSNSKAKSEALEKAKGGKKDRVSFTHENGKKVYGAEARKITNTIPE